MKGSVLGELDRPGGGVGATDDLSGDQGFELGLLALIAEQAVIDGPLSPGDGVVMAGVRIEVTDVLSAAIDEDVGVRLGADSSHSRGRGQRRYDGVVTESRGQSRGAGYL